jgi:5-formyltetrahydrofolate cyclo-ligase
MVALYAAAESAGEVSTLPLFYHLRKRGTRTALPRVRGKGPEIDFFEVDDWSRLEISPLGIPEPRGDEPAVDPGAFDAVIVPGVAFDAQGGRVGYGMGCYDRALPRVRPGAPLIGLAYDFQMIDRAPMDEHDVPLTAALTETRTFLLREGRD